MKKTIVMIGNTSWGMFQFRSNLMQELLKRGHKVVVLAPPDPYSQKLRDLGVIYKEVYVSRKGTNPFFDIRYTYHLIRILLEVKTDLVLSYTVKPVIFGTLAAWIARVPQRVAITTGLGYVFSHHNFITQIAKLLYKSILVLASEVWFLNQDDVNTFVENELVAIEKAFLLPGEGVDVNHYCPLVNSKKNNTFTLISRMLWDKGVGIFVDCARDLKQKFPDLNFLIVGPVDEGNPEGIPLSQLLKWHEEGIISYVGPVDDIRPILENTACLIHPTYYKEGLPRILMEACAMGVPCITTDIPGCKDVIQNGINGYLSHPRDTASLKKAVISFLELDPSKISAMAFNGRNKIVAEFSSSRINSIYETRLDL